MEPHLFNGWADIADKSGFPLIRVRASTNFYIKEEAYRVTFWVIGGKTEALTVARQKTIVMKKVE